MDAEAMHEAGLRAAASLPPDPESGATPTDATPAGEPAADAATPAGDSFTKLDPNALPPELRPFYDSMQADYTRKTQQVAPLRHLAEETGLDADGLRNAVELYAALQDPQQLVQFHSELSAALEQSGLSPAEAAQAATDHITGVQQQGADPQWSDDPDERRVQELEARLNRFEAEATAREERIRAEQMQAALIGEMNRQESLVRESHPDWNQDDIDAVYELAPFYGGSLLDASQRYDEIVSGRLARILNGKVLTAANPSHAPMPRPSGAAQRGMDFGDDLDAAHKAALEAAKLLP